MPRALLVAALALCCARAEADVVYQQPPSPAGGFYRSSWLDPDGSNYDQYVWDAFTLADSADIVSVTWRGAYDPAFGGGGGPVMDFTIGFYASIPGGSQPDVAHPPLVEYTVGSNAGESPAGLAGGVLVYEYAFVLPAAFHAQAGVKYWIQIEGWQQGIWPDWGISAGQGGDGSHFLCDHNNLLGQEGVPTGCSFSMRTGDGAFTLNAPAPTAVPDAGRPGGLSLAGARPHPVRGDRVDVWFTLPDAAPAVLAVYDVRGRRLDGQEVGALGAGTHVVRLAAPRAPGVYFARLSRAGIVRTVKVIVTR